MEAKMLEMAERKRKEAEKRLEMEEERLKKEKALRLAQEQKRLEMEEERLKKEKALRLEQEQKEKLEMEEVLKSIKKKEVPQRQEDLEKSEDEQMMKAPISDFKMNTTYSKDESMISNYDMTPKHEDRVLLPSTAEDYNIYDLNSDDSTDDEDAPRKTVPNWA